MVFYITFLRALAAVIITNSHYTGVYPTDLIANGGLLGDVIFFAVSGFCLYNIKMNFGKWYLRRVVRVYPAPIIITAVYMIIGLYARPDSIQRIFKWFIYPTNYHFIASIMVLYIPFYFVAKIKVLREKQPLVMLGVFIAYLIIYFTVYDKSHYHIDTVREPMIRFLFFEAMLLGGYFKENHARFKDNSKITDWIICGVVFFVYFVMKTVFAKVGAISAYQFINQIVIFILLYFVMKCFAGIDTKLEAIPEGGKKIIKYLSEITLEIYVVQYAIIPNLAKISFFPLNWLIITSVILGSATLLHMVVKLVNKQTDRLFIK